MRKNLIVLLVVVGIGSVAYCVEAETRLKEQVSAYRNLLETHTRVKALDERQLEQSRQKMIQASQDFEVYLNRGKAEHTSGWKRYLKWMEMQQTLAQSTPDVDVLKDVLVKYRRDEKGLEQPPFTEFRGSLNSYLTLLRFAASDELTDAEDTLLDDLALRLARYEVEPKRSDALAIGERLAYLDVSGAASGELLDSLRKRFDHPNGFLRVNNRMVSQMLQRDVDDTRAFSRNDGQVTTRGTARTTGKVSMRTAPWTAGAAFDVRLLGTITAPNMVSQQRNVTVYSSCRTRVDAWKRIKFTETGFQMEPARAYCNSDIRIKDISARGPVIEMLAGRRVDRDLPEFEQQSSQISRREITQQVDDEVEGAIKEADHVYNDFFRTPLIRFGALPKRMDFYTTTDHVGATVHMTGGDRLGAPGDHPALDPQYDIGLQFHESFIDNYCAAMFAGKTVTDKQWVTIMNIMTGIEPRALWVHDRADRWSFAFHEQRPLEVDFRDSLLTFSLRSHAITRAGKTTQRTALVRATYKVELGRDGVSFARQGALVTRWEDEQDGDDELIDFVAHKFSGVLQPELHFDGLVPPAGGSLGKLRQIQFRKFETTRGWLTMGFELIADEPKEAAKEEK